MPSVPFSTAHRAERASRNEVMPTFLVDGFKRSSYGSTCAPSHHLRRSCMQRELRANPTGPRLRPVCQ